MYAVMACSLEGLETVNHQFRFSDLKILSVITSYFTRALEHVSARIVVSAVSEPGKWVSTRKFRDFLSLSVHKPSAFVNRQDGCGLMESNFRSLEASAALAIFSQKVLQLLLLAILNSILYI